MNDKEWIREMGGMGKDKDRDGEWGYHTPLSGAAAATRRHAPRTASRVRKAT